MRTSTRQQFSTRQTSERGNGHWDRLLAVSHLLSASRQTHGKTAICRVPAAKHTTKLPFAECQPPDTRQNLARANARYRPHRPMVVCQELVAGHSAKDRLPSASTGALNKE